MSCQPNPTTAVLKFGGEVIADRPHFEQVLRDVASLVGEGWRFVLCHGGGPQANALSAQLGLEARKIAGQRVTDSATLEVVTRVLAGQVSCQTVALAWSVGLPAVGVSAGVVHARRRPPVFVSGANPELVDYGLVGDVTKIDVPVIEACWAAGRTPVLNPIGVGTGGPEPEAEERGLFNINADTVAAAVAVALGADHLFSMTAVPGVLRDRRDPSTRIPSLTPEQARAAIVDGTVAGGMIPKVEEALAALAAGVRAVHILAPEAGALREEAARGGSRGTFLGRDVVK